MATFAERVIGAACLNVQTYEEVESDRGATGQALGVVLISSLAAAIGGLGGGVFGALRLGLWAVAAWIVWAALIYLIGTKLMPEPETRSDIGELLRTTGFASAPGIVRVLGFIPLLGKLVLLVAAIWMLVAMVVAVRQALDYRSTGRAVVVCLIGWVVSVVVFWIFAFPGSSAGL